MSKKGDMVCVDGNIYIDPDVVIKYMKKWCKEAVKDFEKKYTDNYINKLNNGADVNIRTEKNICNITKKNIKTTIDGLCTLLKMSINKSVEEVLDGGKR